MAKKKNKHKNNFENSGRRNDNDKQRISVSVRKRFAPLLETDKYNRCSSEYRANLKKMIEETYNNGVHSMKELGGKDLVEKQKIDGPYRKRRLSAILEFISESAPEYAEKYPDISIEDELTDFISELYNSMPMELESEHHITTAMAMFILDAVEEAGNMDAAVFYIPYEKNLISEVSLPEDFCDSMFDNDLIKGMVYLISHRNDNAADWFVNPITAKITPENGYVHEYRASELFMSDDNDLGDAMFDEARSMSYGERYKRVLSYIRPEIIERAVGRYKSKFSEILDIYLLHIEPFIKERREKIEYALEQCKELERYENMLLDARKRADECQKNICRSSVMSIGKFSLDDNSEYDVIMEEAADIVEKLKDKATFIDEVTDELESIERNICERQFDLLNILGSRDDFGFTYKDKEFLSALEKVRVDDPFEVCFAYLYMLDSGDHTAWLIHPVEIMLGFAGSNLPWTKEINPYLMDFLDERDRIEMSGSEDEEQEKFIPKTERYVEDNIEYSERIFTQKYTDYHQWVMEGAKRIKKSELFHLNLSQVVYNSTGMCIPRKHFFEVGCYDDNGLKKAGFSAKEIPILKDYLSLGAFASIKYGFDTVLKVKLKRVLNKSEEKRDDPAELKAKIASINEENASLKNQLYKAEKALKDYKEKVSGEVSELEADRQELIELRELVYKLQNSNGAEPELEETSDITLPYNTNQRVVIFGGHATWLKAIKPMLPNVKFIDPYTKPDANLIRHADVVWMQTNAMPHSFYGKIMEIVRQRKIPVKYFAYASADKCAKQLAEDDMKVVE